MSSLLGWVERSIAYFVAVAGFGVLCLVAMRLLT
jgi:hypothetical protein